MNKVLDAYPILAFLQNEKEADKVEQLFESSEKGKIKLYISIINIGEVYYRLYKLGRVSEAEDFVSGIRKGEFPIEVVPALNKRVLDASKIKAKYPISFADSFAAALSVEFKSVLVTGDGEFRPLEKDKVIKVQWL